MSKAQEIGQRVQGQTLDAVRKTQDAVVEAVTAWTETANKIPGYARLNKQFPAATEVIVAATAPKATKTSAPKAIKTSAPAAAKKAAPAATKTTAARKTATAAKKSSTIQPRARRSKNR